MREMAIIKRNVIIAIWMVFVLIALIDCALIAEFKSIDVSKTGEQQIPNLEPLKSKAGKIYGSETI